MTLNILILGEMEYYKNLVQYLSQFNTKIRIVSTIKQAKKILNSEEVLIVMTHYMSNQLYDWVLIHAKIVVDEEFMENIKNSSDDQYIKELIDNALQHYEKQLGLSNEYFEYIQGRMEDGMVKKNS